MVFTIVLTAGLYCTAHDRLAPQKRKQEDSRKKEPSRFARKPPQGSDGESVCKQQTNTFAPSRFIASPTRGLLDHGMKALLFRLGTCGVRRKTRPHTQTRNSTPARRDRCSVFFSFATAKKQDPKLLAVVCATATHTSQRWLRSPMRSTVTTKHPTGEHQAHATQRGNCCCSRRRRPSLSLFSPRHFLLLFRCGCHPPSPRSRLS